MPVNRYGQLISFAVDQDPDTRYAKWVTVKIAKGSTVREIATQRGHPEDARRIAEKNGIRSILSKLGRTELKVPGMLRDALSFDVLPEGPPTPIGGYAKLGVLDRPERVGITTFEGYDPMSMSIPIRFESWTDRDGGAQVERDIALLERMAGRGAGADADGPPPIIRLSTTGAAGQVVPLIPSNYQWSLQNRGAPTWRISGIDWDENPLRNGGGRRLRQLAVVTVQQHTKISLATKTTAKRAAEKKKAKTKLGPATLGRDGGTVIGGDLL